MVYYFLTLFSSGFLTLYATLLFLELRIMPDSKAVCISWWLFAIYIYCYVLGLLC